MEVTQAASSEGAISAFVNAFLGVRGVSVNGSFLAQFPLSSTERLPTTLRAINSVSSSVLSFQLKLWFLKMRKEADKLRD